MTRSSLHLAYLIKGWLLDKQPPEAVTEALEMIIAALTMPSDPLPLTLPQVVPATPPHSVAPTEMISRQDPIFEPSEPAPVAGEVSAAKKKRAWSEEARAAAAERMRARQAAGQMKGRKDAPDAGHAVDDTALAPAKPVAPDQPHRLTVAHGGYAGRRDPGQELTDADWPDIKARLDRSPDRRAIAGDYDVDLDDLNFFIQSCQRREQRVGEALAPRHHGA